MRKGDYKKILELILGKEECERIITQAVNEYHQKDYNLDDFEIIVESYFIAILVIGFSKKKLEIDKYAIHLVNESDININTKEFCEKYKKYIEEVEQYKFELLRKLI